VVFLIRVPEERQAAFLGAYERVRHVVAGAVPGHLVDQVCQSADGPGQWLITSEWARLSDFRLWEASAEHRDLIRPMRECITEARSLKFTVTVQTGSGEPPDQAAGRS